MVNPVTLPPGRAKFCTKPERIGSATSRKTIGRPALISAEVAGVERLTTRSGRLAAISFAAARTESSSAPGQRKLSSILPPCRQPRSCKASSSAPASAWPLALPDKSPPISTATRRFCSRCARAARGRGAAAAAPPKRAMNSRLCMPAPTCKWSTVSLNPRRSKGLSGPGRQRHRRDGRPLLPWRRQLEREFGPAMGRSMSNKRH